MLFEAVVDEAGVKEVFGDVLPVVEAWCKKNDTGLMITDFCPGEHREGPRKFGLAGFTFLRPIHLVASDLGELISAVGVDYFVDSRVLRMHIAKRPVDKWDFRHGDGCVCFVCRGRNAANSNNG